MVALHRPNNAAPRLVAESGFLSAFAEVAGDATPLLVLADWLDERGHDVFAANVRRAAPVVAKRYARAAGCLDALLGVEPARLMPFPVPPPDMGASRSRRQMTELVRAALRPLKLPGVSVARAWGWRNGGADVVINLPRCDLWLDDGAGGGFAPPWGLSSADVVRAGVLAFTAVMPALFPDEAPRLAHDDGESFETHFWRVEIRPQS